MRVRAGVWSPGVGNPWTGDGRWPASQLVLSVGVQGGGVDGVAWGSAQLLTRASGRRFTEATHPPTPALLVEVLKMDTQGQSSGKLKRWAAH